MIAYVRWTLVILPLVTALFCVSPAEAQSRRRGKGNGAARAKAAREATIKAAQSQYAQGEAALNAASSSGAAAEAQLASIIGRMQSAVSSLKQAQAEEADLLKELADLEKEILSEQAKDSPYALAHIEFDTCRAELTALETKLLTATDYLARKATLAKQPDGPTAVATLRKDTLEAHPDYTALQLKMEQAAGTLSRIKHELFAADTEWKSFHDQVLDSRKDAGDASTAVYRAAPEKSDPLQGIKTAKQAAAAARSVMAQAESVLSRYNAPTKAPAKPSTASKAKK